jgi:hypothetical protein
MSKSKFTIAVFFLKSGVTYMYFRNLYIKLLGEVFRCSKLFFIIVSVE